MENRNDIVIANLPIKLKRKYDRQIIGLIVFIVLLSVIMSFKSPTFLSYQNFMNIFRQSSAVMLIAFGMTFVLSIGGIDLSVGSIIGLGGGMTGFLLSHNFSIVIALFAGLITGILIGICNGLIITQLGITPFIATLATASICRGLLFVWTNSIPFRDFMTPTYTFIGQGNLFGVQFPVIITIIAFFILLYVFRKTKFGRHALAFGSDNDAAKMSGINTKLLQIKIYALSGFMAALSGILLASRLETVHPELGKGYELNALAAAIIGGTALAGGKGSLIGTALGAFILYLISNCLNLLNINTKWETIVNGLIILLVIAAEFIANKKRKK